MADQFNQLHVFYHVRFTLFGLRSSVVFSSKFQAMNFCDLMRNTYANNFEVSEFFTQEY